METKEIKREELKFIRMSGNQVAIFNKWKGEDVLEIGINSIEMEKLKELKQDVDDMLDQYKKKNPEIKLNGNLLSHFDLMNTCNNLGIKIKLALATDEELKSMSVR